MFRNHGEFCASQPWEVIVATLTFLVCILTVWGKHGDQPQPSNLNTTSSTQTSEVGILLVHPVHRDQGVGILVVHPVHRDRGVGILLVHPVHRDRGVGILLVHPVHRDQG